MNTWIWAKEVFMIVGNWDSINKLGTTSVKRVSWFTDYCGGVCGVQTRAGQEQPTFLPAVVTLLESEESRHRESENGLSALAN